MIVLRPRGVPREKFDSVAFAPNGRTLVAPLPSAGFLVWDDCTNGSEPRQLGFPNRGHLLGPTSVSPDGELVLCHNARGPAIGNLSGVRWSQLPVPDPPHTNKAAFAPDGSLIVVCVRPAPGEPAQIHTQIDRRLVADLRIESAIWSITIPGYIPHVPLLFPQREEIVTLEHRWKPTDRFGEWELFLVARDPASGYELRQTHSGKVGPCDPVVSADERFVAAFNERSFTAWRSSDWAPVAQGVLNSDPKHFTGIAFHPSGKYLAATSNDKTVKLYDTTTWQVAKTFTWEIGRMRSVAFSPDGTLAAAGSDTGKVVVWDVDV